MSVKTVSRWLITLVFIVSGVFSIYSQPCPPGQNFIEIEITPDNYPGETSWDLRTSTGLILASGDTNDLAVCVADSLCLIFNIYDAFGDGICCDYGYGNYSVYLNGDLVASGGQFQYYESVDLACPAGYSCRYPDTITTGTYTTGTADFWYIFIPDSTGTYQIKTCGLSSCDTRIWVYDHCDGLLWDSTNVGTIYYNDDECGLQSEVFANLQAATPYWIRIGAMGNCPHINWELSYTGPVVGCTDPNACNYNPLATVSDTCIYPGHPDCPDGPDLIVVEQALVTSLYLDVINNVDPCMVNEGCLQGFGNRQVIRFTTHIKNIGTQDFYIGDPVSRPNMFTYDNCHGHYHYRGYAEYLLYDTAGREIPVGFKNGFCVMDLECDGGGTYQYGCSNMGISAGCGDIYGSGLDCQWIDITGLDTGRYTLVVRTNWTRQPDALGRYELDYHNNWAQACIRLGKDISGNFTLTVLPNCPVYTDCLGDAYGSAQPDCEGVCNGPRKMGDLNTDSEYDTADVQLYQTAILNDTIQATSCNDLNNDGDIDVVDIMKLIACINYNDTTHNHSWGYTAQNHRHCEFPVVLSHFTDTVWLMLDSLNPAEKYIDVLVINPQSTVMGFEFTVSGLDISRVVNFDSLNYQAMISHNDRGRILGYTFNETFFRKNLLATPFLRIYYDTTTAPVVCLAEVKAIVNRDYEEVTAVAVPSCDSVKPVTPVLVNEHHPSHAIRVVPQVNRGGFNIVLDRPLASGGFIEVTGISGKSVFKRKLKSTSSQIIPVNLQNISPGIYFIQLRDQQDTYTSRVTIVR